MKRRPPGLIISKAIPGFINYKSAEGLSPNTIYSYQRDLNQWLTYQEDVDISKVTPRDSSRLSQLPEDGIRSQKDHREQRQEVVQ